MGQVLKVKKKKEKKEKSANFLLSQMSELWRNFKADITTFHEENANTFEMNRKQTLLA